MIFTINPRQFLLIIFSFFILKNSFALDSLSYSGRLVQASGAPVVGPVKIRADLAYTNATGSVLCTDEISNVALSKGVFHVKIEFDCSLSGKTFAQVLSQAPVGHSAAIQITDITDGRPPKSYSFQALHAMPYATVASQLSQLGANDGEFLKWNDTDKKWEAGSVSGASGGTVTNVTATSPLSVTSGATTPALTISQANGTTSGYLSSADWNTFNNKEGTLAGGTASQYYRGDKTWQTLDTSSVPENVNLYFTNARVLGLALTGFSATNSAILATDTVVQGFSKAQGQINAINSAAGNYLIKNGTDSITGTVNVSTGFLTITNPPAVLTDATNKQYVDTRDALKVSKAGDIMSGDLTLDSDLKIKGGSNYVTVKGHASSAAYNLFLPSSAGTAGFVLATDGSGNTSWVNPSLTSTGTGTVNSASITDGSIVDADINASAAIAQSKIAGLTTDLSNKEPTIAAGTATQYWKGNKTWSSLQTDVQSLVMNNYTLGANASLANTDTLSVALGKVQGQIDATNTAVAGKEPALTAGTASQYYSGNKTWQTLNGAAVANSAAGNISSTNVQSALNELDTEKQANITSASAITTGSVTTSLQNGVNINPYGAVAGNTGELRFYELTGTGNHYTSLKAPDNLSANINYVLPVTAPTAGQVLSSNASGVMSWTTIPSAPVDSTFGRTGTVVATAGDYNAGLITNTAAGSIAATNVQTALNELDTEKQPLITAGTTAQYYRGDKTFVDFGTDVRATLLTGYSVGSNTALAVGDSTLAAFGKVQGQINATNTAVSGKEPAITAGTTAQYIRGDKTLSTFATDVINSVLSTFSLNAGSKPTVATSDSVVGAFGKVQKYLNDINSDYVSKSADQTINGTLAINSATGFITVPTPINPNDAANKAYVDGFGQWTKSGSDIYRSGGNVGIGTSVPVTRLNVSNDTTTKTPFDASEIFQFHGGVSIYGTVSNDTVATGIGAYDVGMNGVFTESTQEGGFIGTLNNAPFQIRVNNNPKISIDTSDNVDIGTSTVNSGAVRIGSNVQRTIERSVTTVGGETAAIGSLTNYSKATWVKFRLRAHGGGNIDGMGYEVHLPTYNHTAATTTGWQELPPTMGSSGWEGANTFAIDVYRTNVNLSGAPFYFRLRNKRNGTGGSVVQIVMEHDATVAFTPLTSASNTATAFNSSTAPSGGPIDGYYGGYTYAFPVSNGHAWNASTGAGMFINNNGNVGIGTTTPAAKLEVAGTVLRTIAHASGNLSDGTDSGALSGRSLSFTKLKAGTSIRIGWTDVRRALNGGCRWEIAVDGVSCPGGALTFDQHSSNSSDPHTASYVAGYCDGLGAGAHTIQIIVGQTPGYSGIDCYTGWSSSRWMIEAEEVN